MILKKVSNPTDYYEANFELTKQLFDAFLQSEARVFIFLSTVKTAADTVADVLTEEVIQKPITAYEKSKLMTQNYINALS
jgi:UDP-glucose 4-epimerase